MLHLKSVISTSGDCQTLPISLALGFMSRLGALVLFIISGVALITVGIHPIPQGLNALTWYSWLLYLPEPLYMLLCLIIFTYGGTRFSIDRYLTKKMDAKR